ncbi:putative SPEAR family protein [Helianthus annuus]|nr:putative SPEAR family protein [Helianthus annuus]
MTTSSTVTDMSLGHNGVNNGGRGSGRRKTKGSTELTQKKNKQPQRGLGVAKLEELRLQTNNVEQLKQLERLRLQERWKKMTELPFVPTPVQNVAVQFRHPAHVSTPAQMVVQGINMYPMDPSVIGSNVNNACYRFDNPNELYSVSSYMKCASDGCGVCHKKKRIAGGASHCSVSPFRNFCGSMEMTDAGKTRRGSGQVMEYDFFPGKCGGAEENKELLSMGSTAAWCGSGGSVAGTIGLRGGEGSCVTAITGGEEGSVSSLDLSLKLSY